MSYIRFLGLAVALMATAHFLFVPDLQAGGGRGGGGGGGGYHGGGYYGGGYHGGGYYGRGYYGGFYPYGGFGLYLGLGYPYDYYGPYAVAPNYYVPPTYVVPAAPGAVLQTVPTSPGLAAVPASPTGQAPPADTMAHIQVRVPVDAEIWFSGEKTHQAGTTREFVSPPLPPNQVFTYEIRARWLVDGKEVAQTRRIEVTAGSWKGLDFTQPAAEMIGPPKTVKP